MKERPILFSGPMVRAILDGRKTQTRRIVKPQPSAAHHYLMPMWGQSPDGFAFGEPGVWREAGPDYPDDESDDRRCPYGVPGDRLWVRETWYDDFDRGPCEAELDLERRENGDVVGVDYRATHDCSGYEAGCPCNPDGDGKRSEWRPSIFMPRWASRITLEVAAVRVERLHAITEADARAEGFPLPNPQPSRLQVTDIDGTVTKSKSTAWFFDARSNFCALWDGINGKRAPWESNPWVWCVSFRRLERGT